MSLLNENISVKVREVKRMDLGNLSLKVAARPYHALALRLSGDVTFDFDGAKMYSREGDVFFMPAYREYVVDYKGNNEIIVIHFESPVNLSPENFRLADKGYVSSLFYKLLEVWENRGVGYYFSSLAMICELLSKIAKEQSASSNSATDSAFENAIKYMETNYTAQDFSINSLVECAHMSNTYFRRLFAERFGTTPIKHLVSMRTSHAEKLLSSGIYTVAEASEASGFSDVKYFCRAMHREYGVPPSKLYKRIK